MNKICLQSGLLGALALLPADSVSACAACYGKADGPMAAGMNWGILSLLAVIGCVLGSVAAFFIFLAKKSASVTAAAQVQPAPAVPLDPATAGLAPSGT